MSKFNPRRPIRKGITLGQGIVFLVDEIIESKRHWWLRSNEHKRKTGDHNAQKSDNIMEWCFPENGEPTYPKTDMIKWKSGITTSEGKKYIKINGPESVWGFIVKEDFATSKGKMFKKGDVLMAAGCNTPALNRARGNVLTGEGHIVWTGPEYLK